LVAISPISLVDFKEKFMPLPFDEQLSLVESKINHVDMAYEFTRYRGGLLYYLQRAEKLHEGAQIIHEAHGPRDVFALLAGLSIEVVLKGIHRALDPSAT
jgi:hypothetical protein